MRTTPRPLSSTRRRGLAGLVAVAAILTLVASACDAPAKPAGTLFDAWKTDNPTKAHTVATNTAVSQMFAKPYKAADQWTFNTCQGAAGSTYCTWLNLVETRLQLRITNATQKVTEVQRISLSSGASGHFFHDWRVGDQTNAAKYASAAAISQLFAHSYQAGAHWSPDSCEGAAGSIYCTWFDDSLDKIVTHYDNVETHKVIGIEYTAHA